MWDLHSIDKKIIVYGAGKIGRTLLERLLYEGLENRIIAIAVTEKKNNPDDIFGISVKEIDKLSSSYQNELVIIAAGGGKQVAIKDNLVKYGFCNITTYMELQWNKQTEYSRYIIPYLTVVKKIAKEEGLSYKQSEDGVKAALMQLKDVESLCVPRLVIILGTKCSMRCKECNNLIPYFNRPQDLEWDCIKRAFSIFLEKVDVLLKCELIGGEPFLSHNLDKALEFLLEQEKVKSIEITTNGTIRPKEALLPLLAKDKVIVKISDYGNVINQEKFIAWLQEKGIRYEKMDGGKWISPGGTNKRGRSVEKLRHLYAKCGSGYYCKALFKDKLFDCARAASLYELGYMKEEEYITVNNLTEKQKLKSFWLKEYSVACDYCDITCEGGRLIEPAEQIQ